MAEYIRSEVMRKMTLQNRLSKQCYMHVEKSVHNKARKRTHIVLIWTCANVCEDVGVTRNTTVVSYTKCLIICIVSKEEKYTTDLYMFNKTSYKINKYAEQLHWHWSIFSPKGYKTSPKVNCSCTNQAQWCVPLLFPFVSQTPRRLQFCSPEPSSHAALSSVESTRKAWTPSIIFKHLPV